MLDIIIIAVGKMKDKNYAAAAAEYVKRLSPYARLKIEELKAEPFTTEADKLKAKNKEQEKLLSLLNNYPQSTVWLLNERGEEFTSTALAKECQEISGQLVLVIGGTLGFGEKLLGGNYRKFALSRLTLPHELARVVLLEQLYRAVCIIKGKSYHY